MIRFDQEEAHIRMKLDRDGSSYSIDMHLKKNRPKGIAINSVPIRKAGELLGLGNFVFFSPEDLNIIKSGPGERRRFMDLELCQLNKVYVYDLVQCQLSKVYLFQLSNYNKILNQRNKLLKEITFRPEYLDMLDVWDRQLVQYGERVIREREKFVGRLNEIIGGIHQRLSGGRETLVIHYEKNVEPEEFEARLTANRDRDLKLRTTQAGPHRDDLCFDIGGMDIRKFGSQGQQRTAALSLKLSEIELVKQEIKDTPVLLLDDVLSELDSSRQKYLLDGIHDIQTLITCTGLDEFVENRFEINKVFRVSDGVVT